MKLNNYGRMLALAGFSFALFSCETENVINEDYTPQSVNTETNGLKQFSKQSLSDNKLETNLRVDFEAPVINLDAVEPSACSTTAFNAVISQNNSDLINGFLEVWERKSYAPVDLIIYDYFSLNNYSAQLGINGDYFGKDGEYTNYVREEVKNLERFWDMANFGIRVHGQHTATLNDPEVIRFFYTYYPQLLRSDSSDIDALLAIADKFNNGSTQIPENPLFASDAFATFGGTIVLGDGIIEMLAATGLEDKIVISSILSHEWAHQIQFKNYGKWQYPVDAFAGTPESTRLTELEADFFTGFYLTHKRGGTYNWKRVEEFLIAFYNIGDCSFTSNGHHGTPLQRLEAAKAGYEFAESLKLKGQLPTTAQAHDEFLSMFGTIVK